METIRKIKVAHGRHETPIRQISKDLRLSRNTIRKVLRSDELQFEYQRSIQPMPKLGGYTSWLEDELQRDAGLPRKHRRTIKVLFEQLQGQGYEGGYDAV